MKSQFQPLNQYPQQAKTWAAHEVRDPSFPRRGGCDGHRLLAFDVKPGYKNGGEIRRFVAYDLDDLDDLV